MSLGCPAGSDSNDRDRKLVYNLFRDLQPAFNIGGYNYAVTKYHGHPSSDGNYL